MPGTTTFDNFMIFFRDQTTKAQLYLFAEKLSSNTYYVHTNDNTIAITAYYVS